MNSDLKRVMWGSVANRLLYILRRPGHEPLQWRLAIEEELIYAEIDEDFGTVEMSVMSMKSTARLVADTISIAEFNAWFDELK